MARDFLLCPLCQTAQFYRWRCEINCTFRRWPSDIFGEKKIFYPWLMLLPEVSEHLRNTCEKCHALIKPAPVIVLLVQLKTHKMQNLKCSTFAVECSRTLCLKIIQKVSFYCVTSEASYVFLQLRYNIKYDICRVLENIDSKNWKNITIINHIKKIGSNISRTDDYQCTRENGCLEQVRDLVLQIKMSEWGLFGVGEVS